MKTQRLIDVVLPAAGCLLLLAILFASVSGAVKRFVAYQKPSYNDEQGETAVSQSGNAYRGSLTQKTRGTVRTYSSANGIKISGMGVNGSGSAFALPEKLTKLEQRLDDSANEEGDTGEALNISPPQSRSQRKLTKAEIKRLEERRERTQSLAYATPDEVSEEAEKEVWDSKDVETDKMEEAEEDEVINEIIFGDKRNSLAYRFISGEAKKSEASAKEGATKTASAQTSKISGAFSSASKGDVRVSKVNDLFSGSSTLMKSDERTRKLFGTSSQSTMMNLSGQSSVSVGTYGGAKGDMANFRSLISSSGSKTSASSASQANKVTISRSTDRLYSGDGADKIGTETSVTPTLRKELAPSGLDRGMRNSDGTPTRALPRFEIKR